MDALATRIQIGGVVRLRLVLKAKYIFYPVGELVGEDSAHLYPIKHTSILSRGSNVGATTAATAATTATALPDEKVPSSPTQSDFDSPESSVDGDEENKEANRANRRANRDNFCILPLL